MSELFYLICFLAALLLSGIYIFNWRKNYDVHLTLIFALVPVVNAGYLMLAQARTAEAAVNAYKIVYIGGCYLHLIIMLAVFSLCGIRLGKWLRTLFMIISSVVYLSVITIGKNDLFYKSYHFEQAGGVHTLVKEYGIMHSVFYMLVIGYFALSLGALIYAFVRKTQVSRKILLMLFLPAAVCVGCYLAGKWMTPPREIVPAGYVFAQLSYLAIVYRISLYDVSETAMEYLEGAKQVIVTGEIEGVPCKGKLDVLGDGRIVDLKCMRDFEPRYKDGERLDFIRAWGYDIQAYFYTELVKQQYVEQLPYYILAVTKEASPDLLLVEIPDWLINSAGEVVRHYINRFDAIKKHEIQPKRCGRCAYCKETKTLNGPMPYEKYLEEVML